MSIESATLLSFFMGCWFISYKLVLRSTFILPLFEKLAPPPPETWPELSVVVAARDEEETLEKALKTLLQCDYPQVEFLLVNDRSRDRTGEIIDDLAQKDPRIKPCHIASLPEGWLGKVHALHCGTKKARGEWILYTDADIHFNEQTLKKAIAHALYEECDHFTLCPFTEAPGFWLKVVINSFGSLFFLGTRAWAATRSTSGKKSPATIGIGAFNLVRSSFFKKTEGFPWLRMEVGDDVGLALLIKKAGGRNRAAIALEDLRVLWYPSLGAMFKGLEKNLFPAMARYSIFRTLFLVLLLWGINLSPFIALYQGPPSIFFPLGLVMIALLAIAAVIARYRFKQNLFAAFLAPLGHILITFMLLRSAILCLRRGGIDWRDTHYPLSLLKKGQRVKL